MIEIFKHNITIFTFIPALLVMGIYISHKLRWIQFRGFVTAWRLLFKKNPQSNFSSFAAVTTILGGNLGTGNIAGIAVALSTGGPGALFWMWIMAIVGAAIKYQGCRLAVMNRISTKKHHHMGGPMYYIANELKAPKLAKFFCLATLLSALTVGNLVQMNSLSLPLNNMNIPPSITGAVISLLVALVIFGRLKNFSILVTRLVPLMAIVYVGSCLYILIQHHSALPDAFSLIFKSAFGLQEAASGALGYSFLIIIQTGFDRGLFATDAGAGLAPIVHASVHKDPKQSLEAFAHEQGLISMVSPFIVMFICLITGLTLIVTNSWCIAGIESTNMCMAAFVQGMGHELAAHIVIITLLLFAFTTMLTWLFCADKAVYYLFGAKGIPLFRVLFVCIIPLGALIGVNTVWIVGDLALNTMFAVNIMGVAFLTKKNPKSRP